MVAVLVPGGAREAPNHSKGEVRLVLRYCAGRQGGEEYLLRERRGFIRLALQHGASLVPSFSFGEKTLYNLVRAPCPLLPASCLMPSSL